ncbi:L,D-transpeptidase [Marinobacterium mangrovicola]|uniref:L,D-transpeptidase-like protein n=1 Tax=Marinobacterium mangrovicola TaxID=1476959 RepID=A0A4R1GNF2_9GAMM|nr:L,D-transpeptidase [Marinobacterium mangrovicola]TCK08871.1 L,D-transpeptidase-like protein [Marinobacterium mangrovicola]
MYRIEVSLGEQRLRLIDTDTELGSWSVSTALNGAGETNGSGCTPRGAHYIRACIGADQPLNAVFIGRRPTGEIYSPELAASHPGRDWILTRILWLCGREPGKNRLGNCDSQRRYIYIHGTPDTEPMGVPLSHGCIRMRNADLLELFSRVQAGTPVDIHE